LLLTVALLAPLPAAAQDAREAAVLLARQGHIGSSIKALRALLARDTRDPLVAMDLAVILQQAGRPAEAVVVFEGANAAEAPSYALLAMTRAYRDLKRFDRAEALARGGERRFPGEPVWIVMLGLILADAGKGEAALAVLASPAAQAAPGWKRLLAQGYAARRIGKPFDALRFYALAAQLDPANAEAREAISEIMQSLRAPWAASGFVPAPPPLALQADQAAARVHWGEQVWPFDPAQRFVETDEALAELGRLIDAAHDQPALLRQLRLDRMVALRDRSRMAEVVSEARALRADGELPP
jgi:biofilm PGA synthesis protein PgaA